MRYICLLIVLSVFWGCAEQKAEKSAQRSHPSHKYTYIVIEAAFRARKLSPY